MDSVKVGDRVKAGRKHGTVYKVESARLCIVNYDRGEWDFWLIEDLKPLPSKRPKPAASEAQQAASAPADSGQSDELSRFYKSATADDRAELGQALAEWSHAEAREQDQASKDAEIERLRERVDELESVMTPFATLYKEYLTETDPTDSDDPPQFEEWLIEKLDDSVFAELFTEAFAFARSVLDAARK